MVGNIGENLKEKENQFGLAANMIVSLTRALKSAISSSVKVSALAMMGIKLTLVWSLRINSISICFKLCEACWFGGREDTCIDTYE